MMPLTFLFTMSNIHAQAPKHPHARSVSSPKIP